MGGVRVQDSLNESMWVGFDLRFFMVHVVSGCRSSALASFIEGIGNFMKYAWRYSGWLLGL